MHAVIFSHYMLDVIVRVFETGPHTLILTSLYNPGLFQTCSNPPASPSAGFTVRVTRPGTHS